MSSTGFSTAPATAAQVRIDGLSRRNCMNESRKTCHFVVTDSVTKNRIKKRIPLLAVREALHLFRGASRFDAAPALPKIINTMIATSSHAKMMVGRGLRTATTASSGKQAAWMVAVAAKTPRASPQNRSRGRIGAESIKSVGSEV